MLDENLPTFLFRPMPDHPNSAVVYFTRSGSDPAPEYVLRLADPVSKPECRGVYAAALTDPYNCSDVVYGEVAVRPDWQQPSLSAAELREQRERRDANGGAAGGGDAAAAAPIPKVPESFALQLYNPDQAVAVRWTPGSWNKTESWEFDMPTQSFRMPSASRLDRQEAAAAAQAAAAVADALVPKTTFRWKRDGRLGNKDMTCYMVGRAVSAGGNSSGGGGGGGRRKEPDITVALFKHGRDPSVTIYEPNLHRVDVQDRKGLELVLLLTSSVVRDLYLTPRADPFNVEGAAAAAAAATATATAAAGLSGRQRKNSRPAPPPAQQQTTTTLHNASSSAAAASSASTSTPSAAAIDAETKRLQAMLAREERERAKRVQEEERRIKKMLEAEEKEQRRRDAEVAKETERLRKKYGTQGQELPSAAAPTSAAALPQQQQQQQQHVSYQTPPPPPRPPQAYPQAGAPYYPSPALPPRPVSAGPRPESALSGLQAWWHERNNSSSSSNHASGGGGGGGRYRSSGQRELAVDSDRNRVQKKRSVYF